MTYPPQQPGPYGPQDPYGQQNPYGQQPQYGAPQWGQQPGYPAGPPPKKSRTGLIVTLVIVAVLVVGGGGVAAFLLLKDDGGGGTAGGDDNPRATADAFVKELGAAVSSKPADATLDKVKPLMCASDYDELNGELKEAKADKEQAAEQPDKTTFTVSNFKEEGESATFDMTQKRGDDERDPMEMDVKKEEGHWVVCGIYRDSSEDAPGGGSDSTSSGSDGPANDGTIPNPIPKSSN